MFRFTFEHLKVLPEDSTPLLQVLCPEHLWTAPSFMPKKRARIHALYSTNFLP